jgi:hypothetical protein
MIIVRTMSRSEIDLAAEWAAAEGWNPGLSDSAAFHAADPGGFLIALDGATPVACISVARYSADFGFLGFYIAHPSARGRGHGMEIWRAGMARLASCNVGLDGVVAQQANYIKSGFKLAWRNIRFEGAAPLPDDARAGLTLMNATDVPFDRIAAFDRRFFPAARDAFLSLWISLPGHRARVAIEDGEIVGFAVARPCLRGTKIGPLYSADATCALALLHALDAPDLPRPIIIDVPEANSDAVKLAESLSLTPAFETARMYTGAAPSVDMKKLFGITTFELG